MKAVVFGAHAFTNVSFSPPLKLPSVSNFFELIFQGLESELFQYLGVLNRNHLF